MYHNFNTIILLTWFELNICLITHLIETSSATRKVVFT